MWLEFRRVLFRSGNLELIKTQKNRLTLFENGNLKKGVIRLTKSGCGFVNVNEEKDIYINPKNIKGAINNDIVAIKINKNNEGEVVNIKSRENIFKVGETYNKGNDTYVKLDDLKFKYKVKIIDKRIVDGMKVSIRLGDLIYTSKVTYKFYFYNWFFTKEVFNVEICIFAV